MQEKTPPKSNAAQKNKAERKSNAERTAETSQRMILIARQLFAEKGYAGTSTPEIVKAMGVTRGALYHHFGDKLGLFRAIIDHEARQVADDIKANSIDSTSAKQALLDGALAYFDAMAETGRAELLLVEGPAVLGYDVMAEIDAKHGGNELKIGLDTAIKQGELAQIPSQEMADILSAAFDRAALSATKSPDRRDNYIMAFRQLFLALLDWKR